MSSSRTFGKTKLWSTSSKGSYRSRPESRSGETQRICEPGQDWRLEILSGDHRGEFRIPGLLLRQQFAARQTTYQNEGADCGRSSRCARCLQGVRGCSRSVLPTATSRSSASERVEPSRRCIVSISSMICAQTGTARLVAASRPNARPARAGPACGCRRPPRRPTGRPSSLRENPIDRSSSRTSSPKTGMSVREQIQDTERFPPISALRTRAPRGFAPRLYERGPVVNPRASAGRSVAARGGRPTAWTPAELRPDVGCWRPLWTAGGLVVVWSSAHVSIASSTSRTRCYRGSLRRRMSKKDCQAVRREMALAGAKGLNGWLRVSMYQIASVSLRASSIWATFAPRWRPRRRLVRW